MRSHFLLGIISGQVSYRHPTKILICNPEFKFLTVTHHSTPWIHPVFHLIREISHYGFWNVKIFESQPIYNRNWICEWIHWKKWGCDSFATEKKSNHNRFTTESETVNGFGFWEKSAVDSVVNLAPNLSRLLKCSSLLPTPVKQICLFEDSWI